MTGVLLIDKPLGITSFGVIAKLRKLTKEKKLGHSGTLDPGASGVMTVLCGKATRFCELLPDGDKEYSATIKLGVTTDTLDADGTVTQVCEVNCTKEQIESAVKSFVGEIEQTVPMFSAVSVNGERLYSLARQGKEVERPTRKVKIYGIDILSIDLEANELSICVACSKGTYIRQLAADIGETLGCGAHITALRRTMANGFSISRAKTLEEIAELCEKGEIDSALMPVDEALSQYKKITVTQSQGNRFSNGGELFTERLKDAPESGFVRVYSPGKGFIGVGEIDGELMKVKRVFKEDC